MARLFKVKDLEARRRALAAEAEVYRQALTLEIQNLRLYTARQRQRFNPIVHSSPTLKLLLPIVAGLLGRKRPGKWSRLIALGVAGWQAYKRFGPMLRNLMSSRTARNRVASGEARTPAANI